MGTNYDAPPAANFDVPLHNSFQRGHRMCDQCGAVESPSLARFRLCGGCQTTQYCSSDCQKIHWSSHKAICQHTTSQVSAVKTQSSGGYEIRKEDLTKFTSAHAALLAWAGFQALQLKRIPANLRQNALLVELTPTDNTESHRRFSIAATHVVPRTYICDPLVIADIQRREKRCRQNGGIGTAVIIIQCGGISQVMPVEVDPPSKISWESRDDWAHVLHHFVESGRTDFQPISTTPRG
ncbi:hypothetical protein B0H11DRAFT_2159018 [Mycena galericulata]|nr:hypothetical protein B0H11DRAFT_2159018 [Mycena galericulata]